jgi:hypothetical protein
MMRRRQLVCYLVLGVFQIIFHIEHPKEDLALIAFLKDYPISVKTIGQKTKTHCPQTKISIFKCDRMNISLETNSRKVDEIIFHENMKVLIVECSSLTFCSNPNACKHFPKNTHTHTHTQVTILGSAENQHPPST